MAELPPIGPEKVMQRDVGRLIGQRRRLAGMDESDPKRAGQLEKFSAGLQASMDRRRQRLDNLPRPDYDPDLPIAARADDIIEAIRKHQVVVIAGETGSGKSTQLPKMAMAAGRGVRG